MKISLNWLNDYVDIKKENPKEMAEKITRAGVNVEGIEVSELNNLIVGYVEDVKEHPNSDHLKVCMVDLGDDKKQIICGAPNVKEGQKVVVAKVGSILPGNFAIKKATIRGVESEGMICALFELDLEDKETNYDKGIHILDSNAKVGVSALPYLGLDDVIYDLDLNPNRNDCLSYIGFAYETAAVLDKEVKIPEIKSNFIDTSIKSELELEVKTKRCSMYQARMVKDVIINESPDFIKRRLTVAGIRSINNVIDISNYVMLEYGQPLHFFDKDKLGNKIIVRMAQEKEKTITLDNKERELITDDIVITNDKEVVAIAGVMGCVNSEIDDNTKNIVIESAVFDPYNVRYTSIRLDLRSEASLRFEKGLNYEYTNEAIERACYLLEKYASGKVLKDKLIYDDVKKDEKNAIVSLNKINDVIGIELTNNDVMDVFRRLKFKVNEENNIYKVTIPNRRMDVSIKEDLIEEIGRLYGYDQIVGKLPILPIKKGSYYPKTLFRKQITKRMRALGLDEVKTYTLISEEEDSLFQYDRKEKIKVQLPISSNKNIIRQSLISSLLNVLDYNNARSINNINIYEISNIYYKENDKYIEKLKLSILMNGDYINNLWQNNSFKVDFYIVKGIVENLLEYLGFINRYTFKINNNLPKEVHPGISAEILVDNEPIGYIGKIHPQISKKDIYIGEVDLEKLFDKKIKNFKYQELSKYPTINKDVAFILDKEIAAEEVLEVIKKAGEKLLYKVDIFDVYEGKNIGENKKSIAFNLSFIDYEKTLTDKEVNVKFEQIINKVISTLDASVRNK